MALPVLRAARSCSRRAAGFAAACPRQAAAGQRSQATLAWATRQHRISCGRTLCATTPSWRPVSGIVGSMRSLHSTTLRDEIISFKLADIGEGIAEAELLEWHVKVGDHVSQFEAVCDVQSDKATVDISSRYDGKVVKLYYEVGDMAKVGEPLVDFQVEDTGATDSLAPEALDVIHKVVEATTLDSDSTPGERPKMIPAVRRLVKEHNINLALIQPTGKGGRYSKEDILAYLETRAGASTSDFSRPPALSLSDAVGLSDASPSISTAAPTPTPTATPAVPVVARREPQPDVVVPIRGVRRAMVAKMSASLEVPHFGYSDELVMDELINLRQRLQPLAEARGTKLSYMPFFIKALSLSLLDYRQLNAHVNADCTEVLEKGSHNIGVAMDTPSGLVVPNIKDAQSKSLFEIAQELNALQALGAANKLTKEQLTGGTITLSNIGVVGGTYAKPVVSIPEVAIAALGKLQRVPRFDEQGEVVPVNIINVSWSCDHRVLDGVTVARFSNQWKAYLEDPSTMLFDLA
eukprot:m.484453 g.484453  ORF g.484453 m.484453 type:complete len:521 (+) comp23356_c0_seq1:286-1848(+)